MARKATNYIVIHCSQTRPSQNIGAKEIDRWHREIGWLKIGYHKVLRRDGTEENGNSPVDIRALCQGGHRRSVRPGVRELR